MCDKKGKNFYPREEKQPGQGGGSARSLDGKGNVQLRLGPAARNSGKHPSISLPNTKDIKTGTTAEKATVPVIII